MHLKFQQITNEKIQRKNADVVSQNGKIFQNNAAKIGSMKLTEHKTYLLKSIK